MVRSKSLISQHTGLNQGWTSFESSLSDNIIIISIVISNTVVVGESRFLFVVHSILFLLGFSTNTLSLYKLFRYTVSNISTTKDTDSG